MVGGPQHPAPNLSRIIYIGCLSQNIFRNKARLDGRADIKKLKEFSSRCPLIILNLFSYYNPRLPPPDFMYTVV